MKQERRFLTQEVRISDDSPSTPKISGYAAKFGLRSSNLGGFQEIIDPHAFDACLDTNPDIVGLLNHSADFVLGRTSSGTMRVAADETGLKYEIDPPDTQVARDLIVSMKRNDIRSSSFGMYVQKDDWQFDSANNIAVRTILQASVFDCSVVTFPAYPDANSQVRSLFPDGDSGIQTKVAEVRAAAESPVIEKRNADCTCPCPECLAGDCADCSDDDCTCAGCSCSQSQVLSSDERSLLLMQLELAKLQ
jgi:HK97 family phage prohead protease